ncbi:MAG: sensor histidine kinase [Alphaproteobacteria bacterium]|nr:sensor histidine kinase [Alphaproteobacteria bacterium]
MLFAGSLRLRLLTLILMPLTVVALLVVTWQYRQSTASAEHILDQKLSVIALAIFRDLLATEGDILSPATKALFEEASGARFFYHVSGPDGSFINGYSPPPVKPDATAITGNELVFFQSSHRGRPVKVVQLREQARISHMKGQVIVSVWLDLDERDAFAHQLARQGGVIAVMLVLTACAVVFFGIRIGLRPLNALESAIGRRTSADLSPIMRVVPKEVRQIVERINNLFGEVTQSQQQKDRFISNAAHQLRNPVAGLTSMAQVAHDAADIRTARKRLQELITASRGLSRLTEQMLSYERIRHHRLNTTAMRLDRFLENVGAELAPAVINRGVGFSLSLHARATRIKGDAPLMTQVFANLVDNALKYGGDELSEITIRSSRAHGILTISVCNNGAAIAPQHISRIFERFEQGQESDGAGLGLAIVHEIAQQHGCEVRHETRADGAVNWCCFMIDFPPS